MGEGLQFLPELLAVFCVQMGRTFADNQDICPFPARRRLPQSTRRKKFVLLDGTVVVYQQNVQPSFDVAVLEGVIQQDGFYTRGGFPVCQLFDAVAPVPVYGHVDIRKFMGHLERLVSDGFDGNIRSGQYESFRFPLVAPA